MKQLLLLLALLCGLASAQVDITNSDIGPYHILGKNMVAGQVGNGGSNNAFIFTPLTPNQGVCYYVFNNTTTPVTTLGYTISQTGDPNVRAFIGNTSRWLQIQSNSLGALPGTNSGGLFPFYVNASGAAKLVIQLNAASVASNIDLVAVESNVQCGQNAASPILCPFAVTAIVATGTTIQLVTIGNNQISVHVCSYHVTVTGDTITSTLNKFKAGTGTTCGTGTNTLWNLSNGPTSTQFALSAGPGGQLFETNVVGGVSQSGKNLCYTDGGTTGGSAVNVTYNVY